MTDPDRKPETPDLPPAAGTEVPDTDTDTGTVADEEGRDPAEGPTSEQNRTAAETTRAEGGDEPPD